MCDLKEFKITISVNAINKLEALEAILTKIEYMIKKEESITNDPVISDDRSLEDLMGILGIKK